MKAILISIGMVFVSGCTMSMRLEVGGSLHEPTVEYGMTSDL